MVNDSSVFIRNAIPSFLFLLELLFITGIAIFPSLTENSDLSCSIHELVNSINTGSALIIALLSGGFGNLLSIIHHTLYSRCLFYPKVNHSDFIKEMIEMEKFVILRPNHTKINFQKLHFSNNWFIINCIWHQLSAKKQELIQMNKPIDRLSNTLHSSGASFIGVILAIIASFTCISIINSNNLLSPSGINGYYCTASIILSALLVIIHYLSFRRVIENIKHLVETTLLTIVTGSHILIMPECIASKIDPM